MYRPIQRQWLGIWAFALLLVGLFHAMTAQAGMTLAGTVIKNLATVSYQDAAGNKYQATSNESIVTVAEVYAAELQQTQTQNGAAGQTVYFPHRLINNGNAEDSFTLSLNELKNIQSDKLTIYRDVNGDGLPNAGEPVLGSNEKVFVAPGDKVNLVVAAVLPVSVDVSKAPSFKLKATPDKRTPSAEEATRLENEDTINIVDGPVLVATKEIRAHEPATDSGPGSVTYKITIRNNGSDLTKADKAYIKDPLSSWLTVAEGTVGTGNTGIDAAFIDSRLDASSFVVTKLGTSVTTPYAHDHDFRININELRAGSTVALEYTVKYSKAGFSAGDLLQNIASVIHGAQGETTVKTNMTTVKLPQFYGVEAHDRTGADSNHSHQTPDSDIVDAIAKGEVAEFRVLIKNTGNGSDRFNLSIDQQGNSFPQGTTFSYWDSIGAVQYTDEKTPVLGRDQSTMVTIKAKLPGSVTAGSHNYQATLQATSVVDTEKHDSVILKLVEITDTRYGVDISYAVKTTDGADENPYGSATELDGVNKQIVSAGKSGTYKLWVRNESTKPQSFALSAHKSVADKGPNNYDQPVALPDGWKVVFLKNGLPVNTTGYIQPKQSMEFEVLVTLPANTSVDTHEFAVLAQAQDGTKVINDAVKYFVEVPVTGKLTLTPDGQNQIEPGGAVFYEHILENTSNQDLTGITLSGARTPADNNWSHVFFNVADGGALGDQISHLELSQLSLKAGERKVFRVKVIAPANAVAGSIDTLNLTAIYQLAGETKTATATDRTTVIKGQLRLYKKAAILDSCKGDPAVFKENPGKVEPGKDCVVWQIIARNEGDAEATQVTIRDAAPEFTTLVDGSWVVRGADANLAAGNTTSGDVVFNVGEGAKPATTEPGKGGILKPGESVEVRFTVKVN
ncbi:hypothetical protein GCM10023116_36600 [Kistimonas scapharcae]|uniref:DUF11 domain-containing protein n=1 Tax=Kistimonas scapharcae TaxID=1036133 RepID=A0ABP8V6E5_9GAMM